jgi:hypothetical protein
MPRFSNRLSLQRPFHPATALSSWKHQPPLCHSGFPGVVRGTADPSASPDFLSRVAASVSCVWFSLERTTSVVAGESSEAGNPSTLGMTKRRGSLQGEGSCRMKEWAEPRHFSNLIWTGLSSAVPVRQAQGRLYGTLFGTVSRRNSRSYSNSRPNEHHAASG